VKVAYPGNEEMVINEGDSGTMLVLFFMHIPLVVNHTINATQLEEVTTLVLK